MLFLPESLIWFFFKILSLAGDLIHLRGPQNVVADALSSPSLVPPSPPFSDFAWQCQGSKVLQHVHSSVPQIPVPARRFSHIHVDWVGPFPSSRGFTHLYTIVDRTSCWPEAFPLSSTSAENCAWALVSCLISRFGVPAKITSDRGAQFTSSLWGVLYSLLHIACSKTISFHSQSNSLVEHFHHSLKTSLQARLAGPDWFDHLPLVMLGLRTTPPDKTGFSTAEAMYGAPLCLPGEFLDS